MMMRKFLMSLSVVLLLAAPALAQSSPSIRSESGHHIVTPKAEVFAGYSFLRIYGQNAHGVNVSVTGNLNQYFGITGDFSVHEPEDTDKANNPALFPGFRDVDTVSTVLGGPRFTYRRGPVTPFAHILAGGSFGGDDSVGTLVAGGGLDVRVSERVAIRVVQADYFATTERPNNGRFSFGLVFRFGEK
jgi:hypothetical protein